MKGPKVPTEARSAKGMGRGAVAPPQYGCVGSPLKFSKIHVERQSSVWNSGANFFIHDGGGGRIQPCPPLARPLRLTLALTIIICMVANTSTAKNNYVYV